MKPLCFVLMPFGLQTADNGRTIDFDKVYREIVAPGIEDAGLDPVRADDRNAARRHMMLCDFAVADLTTVDAGVLYDLGIRQGGRPDSTVLMFAARTRLPLDVTALRALPYSLDPSGAPDTSAHDQTVLAARLAGLQKIGTRPLHQVLSAAPIPQIARLKTDLFRETTDYSPDDKKKLRLAREHGAAAVAAFESALDVHGAEPATLIDLLLSHRAVEAWQAMLDVVTRMPAVLAQTVLVREQAAFALNRLKRRAEAEAVLLDIVKLHGPSSETNGLLGRVYKDSWQDSAKAGEPVAARAFLTKSIESYLAGFEHDWRDAFPGINAVSLMEQLDPVDPRQAELLPVVRYAVKRRIGATSADYWDHAVLIELAVLARQRAEAEAAAADALLAVRESWEPRSTANNLALIRSARDRRGEPAAWIGEIERKLEDRAKQFDGPRGRPANA